MDETLTRDRSRWQALFEEITLGRHGQLVTVEVLDEELGDQTEAQGLPLGSVSYDERGDVVLVALDGRSGASSVLRHLVHAPREVDLLEQPHASLVMRLVDGNGVVTLLTLTPAAGSS